METLNQYMEFGSLFSGAGGLDLGLEQAGLKAVFQIENDKHCLTLLNRHWPDVPKNEVRPCMGIVGGDPCPIRSLAGGIHRTRSPDLSGYFLAMVYRCKPRWLLRENVHHPDAAEFGGALGLLGYQSIIIRMDSKAFTGQSRAREFVAGFDQLETLDRFVRACHDNESSEGFCQAGSNTETPMLCLTTRRNRMDYRCNYVFEGPRRGIRVLSHIERELVQGFSPGHTDGIPGSARQRAVGNAVTVSVAKWLGERIVEALSEQTFPPCASKQPAR
ncbi:hypothetical protein LCGC14_0376600 [marine sediment metagenome]|uniref:DNA (cytosine-5-)-methyltransferase n=1 Tax=marine sediment metagenome TaxID=412755 RepID=A0A0F9T9E1_9ZZZZ